MVGSISAGRCETMHRATPYLRPSLAILAMARLHGSKPRLGGGRHVAMRLFADERQRHLAFAPVREVEGHARQHRDDDVDDLGRQAGQLDDGDRLVVDRHAEDAAEHLRHAVVDGERAEHEGVAAVLRDGIDARAQLAVGRKVALVLELAHALVDEAGEVGDAIGDGRVDGEAGLLGHGAAHRLVFASAAGAVARLGDGDQLLQDFDLGLAGRIADQDLDDLLEVQEPERQLHVARADDLRPLAEGGGVFVVRVEQHDVRGRIASRGSRAGSAPWCRTCRCRWCQGWRGACRAARRRGPWPGSRCPGGCSRRAPSGSGRRRRRLPARPSRQRARDRRARDRW